MVQNTHLAFKEDCCMLWIMSRKRMLPKSQALAADVCTSTQISADVSDGHKHAVKRASLSQPLEPQEKKGTRRVPELTVMSARLFAVGILFIWLSVQGQVIFGPTLNMYNHQRRSYCVSIASAYSV